jgi:hypothetical protein
MVRTKSPGKTLDPALVRFIREMCAWDVRPSYRRMQDEIGARFPKSEIPAENTIRSICIDTPRGEPWSLDTASPLQVRLVLPVIAAVIEATEGRRTYITTDEARLIARIRLAARGVPLITAYAIARQTLWARSSGDDAALNMLQHFLAFRPWTVEGRARYDAAYEARWIPYKLAAGWDPGAEQPTRYETPEEARGGHHGEGEAT